MVVGGKDLWKRWAEVLSLEWNRDGVMHSEMLLLLMMMMMNW